MIGGIGQTEIIIILAIVLILFGGKNIPKLARSMGQAINNFKSGLKETSDEIDEVREAAKPESSAAPAQLEKSEPESAASTPKQPVEEKNAH